MCRQFHLPVQSGSDRVLRAMRRGYSRARFLDLIATIRAAVPGAAISTDVIVGFPGETEQDFDLTCSLAEEARFSKIHIFPYSPRSGTPAAEMADQCAGNEKRSRAARLELLGEHLARQFRDAHLGTTVPVLWEGEAMAGVWQGLTDDYVRVHVASVANLTNQLLPVRLTETAPWGCWGELAGSGEIASVSG
jgi:threonylcarbamoyladenosine tRNA methylthiotransferase MtaB